MAKFIIEYDVRIGDSVAVNMIVFRNLFQYLKYKLKKSFGKK